MTSLSSLEAISPARTVLYRYALGIVALLLIAPIWLAAYPPLVDYPIHLARAFVMHNYEHIPFYQQHFKLLLDPTPNIAFEVVVPSLMFFFPLLTAGKIFLTLIALLWVIGVHSAAVSIQGRITWLAIPASFLLYNSQFIYGNLNYELGTALFFLCFALWYRWRKEWTVTRATGVCLLGLLCYFAHLGGFAFLSIAIVVTLAIDRVWRFQHALLSLLPLAIPALMFILFMRGHGDVGEMDWPSTTEKLRSALTPFVSYNYWIDASLVLAGLTSLVLLRRHATWDRIALIVAIVFLALFAFSPVRLFTSWGADSRFVTPACVLLILSLRLSATTLGMRIAFCAVTGILLLRLGEITSVWVHTSRPIIDQIESFRSFPKNARVYPICPVDFLNDHKRERYAASVLCYSMIDEETLVPNFAAFAGQQPLIFRSQPYYQQVLTGDPSTAVDWARVRQENDYIWTFAPGETMRRYLDSTMVPHDSIGREKLYKIPK